VFRLSNVLNTCLIFLLDDKNTSLSFSLFYLHHTNIGLTRENGGLFASYMVRKLIFKRADAFHFRFNERMLAGSGGEAVAHSS
jgi:hypothetical protein